MKKISCLSLLLIVSIVTFAQLGLKDPLPRDPAVRYGVLSNGMKYYIRKNNKPEKRAELRLAVNAGSTSEDDDQQGLAHFIEHMAFNGTGDFKKNELIDYLESVGTKFGPHLNAYTSFDETVYMIQLPTDKEEIIIKGIQILKNWAHTVSFDSLEVEKERGVVVEEWRLGQGAEERMRRVYWPLLFKDSRYAERLPIGKKEIIEGAKLSTVKRFYNTWYRPDMMAVIAVGDFDLNTIEAQIKKTFSAIKSVENAKPVTVYQVKDNDELIIARAKDKEARMASVQILYKQPKEEYRTVADYRRNLAEDLFTSMLNDRLAEISQSPNPPFIGAGSSYGKLVRNKNMYAITARCTESKITESLKTLMEENERVKRYGFTASELTRQKNNLIRGYEEMYQEREKTESRSFAREYVSNFLTNEPMTGIEFEYNLAKQYINGVSLEEINEFARYWITNGNNAIVIVTAPEKETTVMPEEADIRKMFSEMKNAELSKYIDKVSDKPLISDALKGSPIVYSKTDTTFGITEVNLQNGVKILFKKTDFKNNEVLFSSYTWGGWSIFPEDIYISAVFADDIMNQSGVSDYSEIELGKALNGKVVNVSPYIGELQSGFNGSSSVRDMETMFQLIYAYSAHPRMDSLAFQSWMTKQLAVIKNKNADPQSIFFDTLNYVMSGYNSRFAPMTADRLQQIKLNISFEAYKQEFSDASGSVYVFVGSFNADTLLAYASKYLGSIPSKKMRHKFEDIGAEPPKGIIEKVVVKGEAPKSVVRLIWHLPFEYNRNNRNEVNVLNKLISIRLREVLREEKSGVYGVSFNSSARHYPVQRLEHSVSFSCNPDNAEMLIMAANDVIEEVKTKGCDEKNLVKIKETFIREREVSMKENQFWLNTIMTNYQNGEDINDLLKFIDWVQSLNISDFQNFTKKYLSSDNYAKFILMPEEK